MILLILRAIFHVQIALKALLLAINDFPSLPAPFLLSSISILLFISSVSTTTSIHSTYVYVEGFLQLLVGHDDELNRFCANRNGNGMPEICAFDSFRPSKTSDNKLASGFYCLVVTSKK